MNSARHNLPLENLHVFTWLHACPVLHVLLFYPSLGGKSEGRRVNIDAHSVPSQPQSIWIHSSLWRTNNLEETLITPRLPPPTRPPHCLFVSPLFVFLSVVPPPSHLVKFLPSTSLSFAILQDILCSHFMYVFPVTTDEL